MEKHTSRPEESVKELCPLAIDQLHDVTKSSQISEVLTLLEAKLDPSSRENEAQSTESSEEEANDNSSSESEKDLRMEERYNRIPLNERKKKSKVRLLQASHFLRLMEDRMAHLESELSDLKATLAADTTAEVANDDAKLTTDHVRRLSEKSDDEDDVYTLPKRPYRKIDEQEWRVFQGGRPTDTAVIEVLKGEIGIGKNMWLVNGPVRPSVKGVVSTSPADVAKIVATEEALSAIPHRIRIHSLGIIKTLEKVTSYRSAGGASSTMVAPYKTLVRLETEIRAELHRLESLFPDKAHVNQATGNTIEATSLRPGDQLENLTAGQSQRLKKPGDDPSEGPKSGPTTHPPLSKDEVRSHFLAIAELRVLVELMDTRLRGLMEVRHQIEAGTLTTITFSNIDLLFNPGDIVFAEEPHRQAYRVFSTSGGLPLDRTKARENRQGSHHNGLYEYNEHDVASPFLVDCYRLAFDGKTYGPVQRTFVIPYYSGLKPVSLFPICPDKVHASGQALRSSLIKNGKLFVELVGDGQSFAHRMHQGWAKTRTGDMEETDSQVIIDFTATFRRVSKWAIKLGLEGTTPQDPREMTDCSTKSTHYKDEEGFCLMCERDWYWPESEIERFRSAEYVASIRDDLQITQSASDLKEKEDKLMLLSVTVFGFALRSRKWVSMNLENISNLVSPEEAFDDLVIDPAHKRLVQALVKTHARGAHAPGKTFSKTQDEYQADIVRGKGRGLIILLHGPPGVGKTSTAECVADLTGRPLFSITCGDIGTEPEVVEKSLDENFLLAHRWECVLLLDEADVFLQERDRTNLKRNSLVSVFLRTLEYYSGILFLTTNREGTLDEAFKSRIHISLHYKRPTPPDWLKIWKNNVRRLLKHHDVDQAEILAWAKSKFHELSWNGRQIRNAFQAATALAKFSAQEVRVARGENDIRPLRVRLSVKDFEHVADASIGFDKYLQSIYGLDRIEERLLREKVRNDRFQNQANNISPVYQPQTSPYQSSSRGRPTRQYQMPQDPNLYQQPAPNYGRNRVPQPPHHDHMPDPNLMSGPQGNHNSAAMDDFWEEDDDTMASPGMS